MSRAVDKRQEQREKILLAAAPLLASQGYHGMSMRSLAKTAGISLANVYNYFPGKDDILFALQRDSFETLCDSADEALAGLGDPVERLYGFISHHVRYFAAHPDIMRVLVHEAASLPHAERRAVRRLKERYFEIGRGIVRQLVAEGCGGADAAGRQLEDEAELDRVTYSLFGMLNWIYGWYQPEVHGSPQQLASTIHEIALCGLVAHCPYRQIQDRLDLRLASVEPPPLVGSEAKRTESVGGR